MLASTVATTLLFIARMVQVEHFGCVPLPQLGSDSDLLVCRSQMLPGRLVGNSPSEPLGSSALERYKTQAEHNEKEVLQLLSSPHWRKVSDRDDVLVKRWYHPKYQRYLYLTEGSLPLSTEAAFRMTLEKGESQPEWNPGMKYVKNLKRLSEIMMLTHQITSEEAGGLIAPREMLLLTAWSKSNGSFLISYSSTEWDGFKPNDKYIYAHNDPSGFQFSPPPFDEDGSSSSKTIVKWLFNGEFSYSAPSVLMNAMMPAAMASYIQHWKAHIEKEYEVATATRTI